MNCFMYKTLRGNNLQAYDSRIKSLVGAYTVIEWKSHKTNGMNFSIKGIAIFLKVWYNVFIKTKGVADMAYIDMLLEAMDAKNYALVGEIMDMIFADDDAEVENDVH